MPTREPRLVDGAAESAAVALPLDLLTVHGYKSPVYDKYACHYSATHSSLVRVMMISLLPVTTSASVMDANAEPERAADAGAPAPNAIIAVIQFQSALSTVNVLSVIVADSIR